MRPRSFGYVVFEGPTLLLDWGVQSFRNGANAVRIPLATKIAALLEDFRPAVVVAKEPPSRKKVNRARTRKILELVRHKASLRGIRTRVFTLGGGRDSSRLPSLASRKPRQIPVTHSEQAWMR